MSILLSCRKCFTKGAEESKLIKKDEDGINPADITSSARALAIALFLVTLFLLGGALFFYLVEDDWKYYEALYFCVVTITTVGYGDMTPSTKLGMWGCMFYILVGIGMVGVCLGIIGSFLMERQEKLLMAAIEQGQKKAKTQLISPSRWRLIIALITLGLTIVVGTTVFYFIEPNCKDWTGAFFLTVQTITTVGYGSPTISTEGSQIFCIPFILFSTLIVASSLGTFADVFIENRQNRLAEKILKADFDLEKLLAMDEDGNGQVDMAEFLEFMLVRMGKVNQLDIAQIKNQFHELDADGSGVLDHDDIALLQKKLEAEKNAGHININK